MSQLNWKQVPQDTNGFVDYSVITAHQIRVMVAEAELIKLQQEHKDRAKWTNLSNNKNQKRREMIARKIEWLRETFDL